MTTSTTPALALTPGAFVYRLAAGPLNNDGTRLGLVVDPDQPEAILGRGVSPVPPDEDEPMVLVRWHPGGSTPAMWEYVADLAVWMTNHERDQAVLDATACVCGWRSSYPHGHANATRSLGAHISMKRRIGG